MCKIKELHIDIETYSSVDLLKCGVYKYAESPDFEILLFGYSSDGKPVRVIDLAMGEHIPQEVIDAIKDKSVIKYAHNAAFERVCLSRYLGYERGKYISPENWRCTMVWSSTIGLPLSLSGVGSILGLEKQKLTEGKDLIKYFCIPCKPTLSNGLRTRNLPHTDMQRWSIFKAYNKRDVEVEMQIMQKLSRFPLPDFLWKEYELDQEINDRGIKADMQLVYSAITLDGITSSKLTAEIKALTGLNNPNSVMQLKGWLKEQGIETDTLGKKQVQSLIEEHSDIIGQVLKLRLMLSKSSVKKYTAMHSCACADNRLRGMFMFCGASRTGRWSGRNVQLQNLRRNNMTELCAVRELVKNADFSALDMLYSDIPDVLSQHVRTAFIPREGYKFFVADFSAIEARVLAWIAGEDWKLAAFAEGKDIYCATASKMFGVPVEKHGANSELRQKGKITELSNGYGGSVNALKAMGAIEMGLSEYELPGLVESWRDANPKIVRLWYDTERAAKKTVKEHIQTQTHGLTFSYECGIMFISLPSGRRIAYPKPKMCTNIYGNEAITYEGTVTGNKWSRIETFGGKLTENITQAIARDILAYALTNLKGYEIVAHVHDEVIIEAPPDTSLDEICEKMAKTPPWAKGLPLRADGYVCDFYMKD